ncbi:putative ankyrin repeat protein RF_0381 [Haliotis cracherodii]|uniref:putative ankyrin repeat protein RF_0381 n=1 Tax=Haliotis cracherodii TaxID=6455 RepID=UPI0039EAE3D6
MDGDMKRVKYLLSDARADIIRADINTRGLHRKTPVMFAAEKAHRDMFDFLVGRGADLSLVDDSGSTILHIACEGGNLDIVNFILNYNIVDINSMDEQECTPAMKAALNGHTDVFNLLVMKGSDLSLVDDSSNTILHTACEGGNLDIVNYVLTQNIVDINSFGNNDRTPAMDAALKGHKNVFDLIVKKGTDLSLSDERGDSILHAACWGGNVEIVKYILTQNIVDINVKGQDMSTPVLKAAYKGHKEVFNVLVRKNADVLVIESSNDGILHLACFGGNMEIIKYILTNCSIDVNDVGEDGFTAAMIAASKGRKDMFDLLLQNRADLSLVDDTKNNILHKACEGGNMELVKHIFEQNTVEINSQSDIGWTPAMEAAYEGHLEVLKLLVSKGADLTLVNDEDNNILHVALEGRHMEVVKYVLTYDLVDVNSRGNENRTPVIFAATEGLVEIFDLIVRKGADLSSITDDKENVLHVACEEGNTEIVKYVLTQNAVNINAREVGGKTPVLVAAGYGYEDIFDLLFGEGADLSIVDAEGENILHKVSVIGNVDMAKHALTQKNIAQDINRKGLSGMTPVMAAAISGHKEVFDLLVKKGADLTQVDGDGNSILHLACRGNVEIVKYLLSRNIVDINRKGSLNRTPVMVAANLGKKATFELLLKQGADMLLVDDDVTKNLASGCQDDVPETQVIARGFPKTRGSQERTLLAHHCQEDSLRQKRDNKNLGGSERQEDISWKETVYRAVFV